MRIYPELLVDQEFQTLGDQGFSGTLNDRQFAFLRSKGYVNALADMMTSWLSYSPANLFALNEPGIWLDPSDVANLDWRRNLLTYTEDLTNAAWLKGGSSAPSAALWQVNTGTALTTSAGVFTAVPGSVFLRQAPLTLNSGLHSVKFEFKRAVFDLAQVRFGTAVNLSGPGNFGTIFSTVDGSIFNDGGITLTITALADGWFRATGTLTVPSTGTYYFGFWPWNTTSIASSVAGSGLELRNLQFAVGGVSDYQRITDVNTEVLERFPRTTMYQDRAGSTAVTTPGQSVGLRLDKSKGLVLGSERIVNGTFDTDISGWTATLPPVSWDAGTIKCGTGTSGRATQTLSLTSGSTYLISVTVTAGGGIIRFGTDSTGATGSVLSATVSTAGTYTYRVAATASTMYLSVGSLASANFDNISVKELPGNHAVANSDAARGIYGIEPLGGRRNLLTFTEQFDNAAWTKANVTVAQNVSGPLGTNQMWTLTDNATNGEHRLFISTVNTSGVYSIYAKAGTLNFIGLSQSGTGYSVFNLANGTVAQNEGDRVGAITSVGDGWYRISMQTVTTNTFFIVKMGETAAQVLGSTTYAGTGKTVLVSGAQLETGSTATAYQRVTTQYDVTEAGKQTLHYVQYDGSDDGYVTPTITPGIDKVQVFAGVRKLSDVDGIVAELSSNFNINPGTFYFASQASGRFGSASRGSLAINPGQEAWVSGYPSPATAVLTVTHDIPASLSTMRANGVAGTDGTAPKGTGNFLASLMYIGRRGGTTLPFNGRDYGIITRFGANLDASTIAATESWLNQKTGVTL